MTQTWLITGCSSGFGKVLAQAVLKRGDQLLVTARNAEDLDTLVRDYPDTAKAFALDVTEPGSPAAAVAAAREAFGGLDILVNNAGLGFMGAIEEATPDEYRPVFETNVFGLIEMTRAALPLLRESKRATVVNLSSGAGIAGGAGSGYYNASKFAVEGLSEALAQELAPLGHRVIIVEPGPFRTEFLGRSIKTAAHEIPAYAETAGKRRRYPGTDNGKQSGDPAKAVAVILKAVDADSPPLHLPLGPLAHATAEKKLASFREDIDAWRAVSIATDFDAEDHSPWSPCM